MNVEEYILTPWTLSLLQQIAQFFSGQQAYLVGGSVRNLLLHKPCVDWDIVTTGNTLKQSRQLANQLGGFYVHLHDQTGRVIVKSEQEELCIDISPIHNNSIESDLGLRDFTINAIATPLVDAVQHLASREPLTLIDPMHGLADITAHTLCAVSDQTFQQDPLRLLRAVRFMQRYHLTIESQTDRMLTRDAALLTRAASERIHDELYTILQPAGTTPYLRFLDAHNLLTTLIPEFAPARGMLQPTLHHWDVLDHSLEAVAALEYLATILQQPAETLSHSPLATSLPDDLLTLQKLLVEAEQQHLFQFTLLTAPVMKMAALLHDIGKPSTHAIDEVGHITFYHHPQAGAPIAQHIMQRISASSQDRRLVQQVVAHHMRPGQLSHDAVTPRAVRRYFVDLGPHGISVALISLADHLAMRGPEPLTDAWSRHLTLVCHLLTCYIHERDRILPPRLIQGEELMRRLNIQPGPLVGRLLEQIAEAQAEGHVRSKEDALWLAQEFINHTPQR